MGKGEVAAHSDSKKCDCRCCCCVSLCTTSIVILSCAMLYGMIFIMDDELPLSAEYAEFIGGDNGEIVEAGAEYLPEEAFEWNTSSMDEGDLFNPRIEKTVEFGDSSLAWDIEFPSSEYPMKLDDDNDEIRVTGIEYKTAGSLDFLAGIRFEYDNGNFGPWLQSPAARAFDSKEIASLSGFGDTRKIAMAVTSDNQLLGLGLRKSNSSVILSEKWWSGSDDTLNNLWE